MDWELKQLECVIAFDNRTQTLQYRHTKSSHVTDFNQSHAWIFHSERRLNIKYWYLYMMLIHESHAHELRIDLYPSSTWLSCINIIFYIIIYRLNIYRSSLRPYNRPIYPLGRVLPWYHRSQPLNPIQAILNATLITIGSIKKIVKIKHSKLSWCSHVWYQIFILNTVNMNNE